MVERLSRPFATFTLEIQREIVKLLPYATKWALAHTSKHCLNDLDIAQPKAFFDRVNSIWKDLRVSIADEVDFLIDEDSVSDEESESEDSTSDGEGLREDKDSDSESCSDSLLPGTNKMADWFWCFGS